MIHSVRLAHSSKSYFREIPADVCGHTVVVVHTNYHGIEPVYLSVDVISVAWVLDLTPCVLQLLSNLFETFVCDVRSDDPLFPFWNDLEFDTEESGVVFPQIRDARFLVACLQVQVLRQPLFGCFHGSLRSVIVPAEDFEVVGISDDVHLLKFARLSQLFPFLRPVHSVDISIFICFWELQSANAFPDFEHFPLLRNPPVEFVQDYIRQKRRQNSPLWCSGFRGDHYIIE